MKHVMKIKLTVDENDRYSSGSLKELVEKMKQEYGESHTLVWEVTIVNTKGL